MSKPIVFRDKIEVRWAKEWIEHQVSIGRMPTFYLKRLPLISDAEQFNRSFASELEFDARPRLQKSLSARRARHNAKQKSRNMSPALRKVRLEVTADVSMKAKALANARGQTVSELLDSYIDDDFSRLPL
jgi:hypothetical protein